MNKYWRMTESQFNESCIKCFCQVAERLESTDYAQYYPSSRKNIKRYVNRFNNAIETGSFDNIYICGVDLLDADVKSWTNTSLYGTDLKELMTRAIINFKSGSKTAVCMAFLSNNSNINEEFIEDIMYVNSGMFSFDEWDDKHVSAVVSALDVCDFINVFPGNVKEFEKIYKDRTPLRLIDYLDWNNMNMTSFADRENFAKKHSFLFKFKKDNE